MIYERTHPGAPWLTQAANAILDSCLTKDDDMLEFGSGRSTIWFAERVRHVTSVEHSKLWFQTVSAMLQERRSNVSHVLREVPEADENSPNEAYVGVAAEFANESLDAVLVDGVCRGTAPARRFPN